MAEPIDYRPPMANQPAGQQVPVYSGASPGVSGAILDMVRAIAGALSPRALVQRGQNVDQQVNQAQGLGNQLAGQ